MIAALSRPLVEGAQNYPMVSQITNYCRGNANKHVAKSNFSGTITAPDNNDWLAILE